jgi:hypothetical protein
MVDQYEEQLKFAVNLITIIEYARHRFAMFMDDMTLCHIAADGSKFFITGLKLIEGMGHGLISLNRDNDTVRFQCTIVANNPSIEVVREQLDRIVSQIIGYLSRDWMITEKAVPLPYEHRLFAIHKPWKLEINTHIIPRVNETFDARLAVICH